VALRKEEAAECLTSTRKVVVVAGSEKVAWRAHGDRQPCTTSWYTLGPSGHALYSESSKRDSDKP
jgi:hypothetical protein